MRSRAYTPLRVLVLVVRDASARGTVHHFAVSVVADVVAAVVVAIPVNPLQLHSDIGAAGRSETQ